MKQQLIIGLLVSGLCVAPAWGQLRVQGGTATFNEFDCDEPGECDPDRNPESGDLGNTGDLYVEFDLEVGDVLYGRAITSRELGASDGDRVLNFLSNASQTFIVDRDNNSGTLDIFEWFENGNFGDANKLAELQADGDLQIRGNLSSGVMFDLAERFVAGEALEPGDVVSVDPRRADGVTRAGASGARPLGVVSGAPGIVLGGTLFSVGDLDAWSPGLRDRFLAQEPALTQVAAALDPELAALQVRLDELRAVGQAAPGGDGFDSREPDPIASLEGRLRRAALDRFTETAFVSVALAGRLPVKVEGPVLSGDYLSASDVPGHARRASGPSAVIGVALEDRQPGESTVMMLVQNGWYGGEARTLASTDELHERLVEQQSVIAAQNEQIESLERLAASVAARMVSLEQRLSSLDGQVLRSAYRPPD